MTVRFNLAFILAISLFSSLSWAGAVITYHGRILDSNDRPVEANAVTFRVRIYGPNPGKCLLYEESRTVSMHGTQGVFVIPIGDGVGTRSSTNDPGLAMEEIFANNPGLTFNRTGFPKFTCNTGGHSYTPGILDQRQLLVSFDDNTGVGEQQLPITDISFVPFAVSAYDAQRIGGTPSSSVLRLSSGTATPMSSAQYAELLSLSSGTSTVYTKANQLAGSALPSVGSGQSILWSGSAWTAYTPLITETDASVKAFAKTDLPTTCGTDKFLRPKSDGSGFDCIAPSGGGSGDITDVVAGTGLSGGGTSGSVTLNLSSVGTAGDYYKVTTDAQGRVTAGQGALVAADIPALPASKITSGTFADSLLAGISVDKILNGAGKYFNYKPANTACADNEVLKYDSTLNTGAGGWKCAPDSGVGSETDPSVSAFAKTTVSTGLKLNGSNQLEVDTGTTVGKIVQLGASGRLPAVDGSLLTNLPTGASFSGSLAGDVTGTQSATVVSRINGIAVSSAVAGDDTKYMKYVHGSGWQANFVKLSELKNGTGTASAFNAGIAGCTAAQTLTWSSVTDQMNCQAINGVPAANITGLATAATSGSYNDLSNLPTLGSLAAKSAASLTADVSGILPIANGGTGANSVATNLFFAGPDGSTGAPSFRAIASSDLPSTVKYWTAATGGINYPSGNVGVGTTTPISRLQVNGAVDGSFGPANGVMATGGSWPTAVSSIYLAYGGKYSTNSILGSQFGILGVNVTYNATTDTLERQGAESSRDSAMAITMNPYSSQSGGYRMGFWTGNGTNPTERLSITGSGNVGIGTTNPAEKLTVNGKIRADAVRLTWVTKTNANTGDNLSSNTNVFLDVSGGAITLNLPAVPAHGDTIKFVHAAGTLSTNNVTINAGTGDTIVGDSNLIMDINNGSVEIIFFDPNEDGNGDWRIM